MTRVSAEDLTKIYPGSGDGDVAAVDDLSLELDDGEFVVLLGPSGCGKTTTLRMIGGLESPTDGTIKFDDAVVNDVEARNRDVAMVFQDFALYPHMNVRRNLRFGLEREDNDYTSAELDARVEDVASMLEIGELLDDRPAELSGGQKQRVALGRAIIREPRLFLFDEPLANLDEKLRRKMRTEIEELQSAVGITSLYVTHDQEEAMTMADRIAILNDGELQQYAAPSVVFNEPANLFVANFIGSPSMNTFPASATRTETGYEVATEGFTVSLPARLVPESVDAGEVVVGFRPDDLHQAGDADETVVTSEVSVIEPLGTTAIVHADTEDGRVTARVDEYRHLEAGTSLPLTLDPADVYLFDASTTELLKPRQTDAARASAPERETD